MIYKPATVTPQGFAKSDMNAVHNRPPVAQLFLVNNSSEKFTMVVNHFKSKSCTGATGLNVDQLDGQGCFNNSRKLQATALLSFTEMLQTQSSDPDIIMVGDFNAYEEEDPIDIFRSAGLINAIPGAYSYVFDGQTGALDYAFTTPSFFAKITGADKWHINADEPILKDYNQEFNPAYVFSPDAFRSSDHDPVLVGFVIGNVRPSVSISNPVNNSSFDAGRPITLTATAADTDGTITKVEFYSADVRLLVDSTAPFSYTNSGVEPGNYAVTAKAFDNVGDSAVSDTVHITVVACQGTGSISAEGYTNIPGSQVADLTNHPSYPNSPSVTASLNLFEYGTELGDNYGARVRGYICAPQTGDYIFYIAGDDQAGLWLSTDDNPANKVLIAYAETAVKPRAWFTYPSQKSSSIRLLKGARYYIETLHKEAFSADHVAIGWILPDGFFEAPIPGTRLSPYTNALISGARSASGDFKKQMELKNVDPDKINTLKVHASPNPSQNYFTLLTSSEKDQPLSITLSDAMGRIVERKLRVSANGSIKVGDKLPAGIYFVEVIQDGQKKRLKLVKR
ncbi:MAG: Ig-like domain-containing protein [Ferruginibacter sp.]